MRDSDPSRDRSLAQALVARQAESASGILTATRGRLKRLFCLDRGWLAFAASNLLEEQFPELLVNLGLLSPADRAEVVAEASRGKAKFGAVLAERRLVAEDDLRAAMERHVETLLSSCLEWPDSIVAFEGGNPVLDGEVTVRLSPIPLILKHARRYPAATDALRARIGPPNLRLVRPAVMDPIGSTIEPDEAGRYVLDRCDGSATIAEIATSSPSGEERTLRAIYGLLLAGLIEATEEAGAVPAAAAQREPPLTREEIEGRLTLSGVASHYAVLGLDRAASRERIRDAYYALARRYHPDRFRSGDLADLRERVEQFFSQVTEAYNTLYYPDRRAEYDAQSAAVAQPQPSRGAQTAHLARQNFLRGRQLAERRRYSEAVIFLENAVRLDEGAVEYRLELGLVLAHSPRRREEAELHLIATIEKDPSMVSAYLGLGNLYQKAGRKPEAARMFHEALRWDPSHAEATAALAALGISRAEAARGASVLRPILKG